MMNVRKSAFRWLLVAAVVLISGPASADTYPNQPIKFVVPFPPGGTTDILARVFAQKMSEAWGQSVVVENRSGAGGIIGTEYVAHAAPDGYTILLGTIGTHAVNTSLYKKLPYDPEKDFAPITLLATLPNLLAINPSLPIANLKELIAYAKANPGKLSFASAGAGTASHLAGEMFRRLAGVDIVHVPYRGSSPALTDLIAGQVSMTFDYMPSALPYVRSGKLRALAVTGLSRAKAAPEIPTMIEGGLPGFNIVTWYAVFAPKGTPPEIVSKIRNTIATVATAPEIVKRMDDLAVDLVASSPEELARFQRGEIERWAKVIHDANIKVE
jgi:tripartite-type tricarboxylate transporter receptor subunit TctC